MAFLTDSKGNLSFIRLSILIAVIGAVFLGGSVLTFMFDQQSRRAPLHIDLPAGAQPWGVPRQKGPGWQEVYYRVPGAEPKNIAAYYAVKMQQHYSVQSGEAGAERCVRFPPLEDSEYTSVNTPNDDKKVYDPDYEPGTDMPYSWKCMFDRGGLGMTQWTQVTIYPGLPNQDPNLNAEGSVVIVYEQRWQP